MLEEHYPFVAQPLPYEYDALLPVLDEETLHFHHDRHYQTYVDKLNATLAEYAKPGRTGALWSSGGGAGPGFWIGETMERTDVTGSHGGIWLRMGMACE